MGNSAGDKEASVSGTLLSELLRSHGGTSSGNGSFKDSTGESSFIGSLFELIFRSKLNQTRVFGTNKPNTHKVLINEARWINDIQIVYLLSRSLFVQYRRDSAAFHRVFVVKRRKRERRNEPHSKNVTTRRQNKVRLGQLYEKLSGLENDRFEFHYKCIRFIGNFVLSLSLPGYTDFH
jgi:hypothetical protein